MSTTAFVVVLLVAFVGTWMTWDTLRAVRVWRRLRGARVVTCPETGCGAGVDIDVAHAIGTALVEHAPHVRLRACTRWPERGRCDEPCINDAADPAHTTRAIAARALAGRACVFCARPIEYASYLDHYAAVRRADGTTIEWRDIPSDRLSGSLRTGDPVCWNCHVTETFRRRFPELVTDRPWPRA
jgi:hypothetical protein